MQSRQPKLPALYTLYISLSPQVISDLCELKLESRDLVLFALPQNCELLRDGSLQVPAVRIQKSVHKLHESKETKNFLQKQLILYNVFPP